MAMEHLQLIEESTYDWGPSEGGSRQALRWSRVFMSQQEMSEENRNSFSVSSRFPGRN